MKFLNVNIRGFGKFYQKSFSFQDGIHIIYGTNEAGKTTLHTFLGCMLFGMQRGRGRAARNSLYTRYLPWDHDAVYGGSLLFEHDDQEYLLERNFRQDNRSCFLSSQAEGRVSLTDLALPSDLLEGLNESLYYNTISIRQLRPSLKNSQASSEYALGQAAPDQAFADELASQLQQLKGGGTNGLSYESASSLLKEEKKRQESLLNPGLEDRLISVRDKAARLEEELNQDSFRQEKSELEAQMESAMASRPDTEPRTEDRHSGSAARTPARILQTAIFILAAGAAIWLLGQDLLLCAAGAALAAMLDLRWLLSSFHSHEKSPDTNDIQSDEITRASKLRERYSDVCRREAQWEQQLEQLQNMEEEIASMEAELDREKDIRFEIQAISLAQATLKTASLRVTSLLGPALDDSLAAILSGLTGGAYTQVRTDDDLNICVMSGTRSIPLESLSLGCVEQVWLALRLAVIDLVFPEGGMPLLLDDCFSSYDDERLACALNWLAENYPGQVFIFTCQKREAALLRKEGIPFTSIDLT